MNVAIIGCGFVGSALIDGINDNANIIKIDPKFNTKINDLASFEPDIIFICVPTPMSSELQQDLTILKKVLNEIDEINTNALVVLKSTVLPNHLEDICKKFKNFVYNPEFLTERNASEDFINSPLIVLGGAKPSCDRAAYFYKNFTHCVSKNYFYTDEVTASLVKYTINSYLATKVIFFNEIFQLFKKVESASDWSLFTKILSADPRIGDSHMQVPGFDNRFGFGGACFPKDTKALHEFSKSKNNELNLLKTVIELNNNIRSEYNSPTNREASQNITFESKKSN